MNGELTKAGRPKDERPTETDKKILEMLEQGHSAKEIAPVVHISRGNVIYRIGRLMQLYGAKNAVSLVAKHIRNQMKTA